MIKENDGGSKLQTGSQATLTMAYKSGILQTNMQGLERFTGKLEAAVNNSNREIDECADRFAGAIKRGDLGRAALYGAEFSAITVINAPLNAIDGIRRRNLGKVVSCTAVSLLSPIGAVVYPPLGAWLAAGERIIPGMFSDGE